MKKLTNVIVCTAIAVFFFSATAKAQSNFPVWHPVNTAVHDTIVQSIINENRLRDSYRKEDSRSVVENRNSPKRAENGTSTNKSRRNNSDADQKITLTKAEFDEFVDAGVFYFRRGEYGKAQTVFEGILELQPNDPSVLNALGVVYMEQDKSQEALDSFSQSIKYNNRQTAAYMLRADIYRRQNKANPAIADLERVIANSPKKSDSAAVEARKIIQSIQAVQAAQSKKKKK